MSDRQVSVCDELVIHMPVLYFQISITLVYLIIVWPIFGDNA